MILAKGGHEEKLAKLSKVLTLEKDFGRLSDPNGEL